MLYFARGSVSDSFDAEQLRECLWSVLRQLEPRQKVIAVPPDVTRIHSFAGDLTRYAWQFYGDRLTDILPAIGTHSHVTDTEMDEMFRGVPHELFRVHDWREGVVTLGTVPAELVREVSRGVVDYAWPAQVGRLLVEGGHDLILSLGQVVPHEVIGMANYNKNIFVGTGGADSINKSHFLGAVYGMERMMGRADTPVRRVLDYASEHFARQLPIVYVHTVVGRDAAGTLHVRGLFIGDDRESFQRAAELALEVNLQMLDWPLAKVVVYLNPEEFRSTWLGNKAIYRTRMAIADGGQLVVLAPGVHRFGEDDAIDRLIRRYGYVGTPAILEAVRENEDLRENLSAAAHLIHSSSEGRFTITYCPGHLTRQEIEQVNFQYEELASMMRRYDPTVLREGFNTLPDGEQIYYISNPALGLWAHRERFSRSSA